MTGAGGKAAPVVSTADMGGFQITAAHGKHRASAVAAHKKTGIDIVVLLDATITACGALFQPFLRYGKGAVVDYRLVMMLENNVIVRYFPGPVTGKFVRISIGTEQQVSKVFMLTRSFYS